MPAKQGSTYLNKARLTGTNSYHQGLLLFSPQLITVSTKRRLAARLWIASTRCTSLWTSACVQRGCSVLMLFLVFFCFSHVCFFFLVPRDRFISNLYIYECLCFHCSACILLRVISLLMFLLFNVFRWFFSFSLFSFLCLPILLFFAFFIILFRFFVIFSVLSLFCFSLSLFFLCF